MRLCILLPSLVFIIQSNPYYTPQAYEYAGATFVVLPEWITGWVGDGGKVGLLFIFYTRTSCRDMNQIATLFLCIWIIYMWAHPVIYFMVLSKNGCFLFILLLTVYSCHSAILFSDYLMWVWSFGKCWTGWFQNVFRGNCICDQLGCRWHELQPYFGGQPPGRFCWTSRHMPRPLLLQHPKWCY